MGFGVRKGYTHKSRIDLAVILRVYHCSSEGTRKEKKTKGVYQVKNPRAETRTKCRVLLKIKLDRESNKRYVDDFISDHNHPLQKAQASHLLRSQRELSEIARYDIDLADESGLRPKEAYELMSRQAGGLTNLRYTLTDHRNYLRDKRCKSLANGEAVGMLNYFYERVLDNSSFQHFEQVDEKNEITNIFWADAKMVADYARFGDVITFDTTFGTNRECRPFGVFVGFNHFREIVVFGATIMFDQTAESFTWVFKTFLQAHNGKNPKTIFTDQDKAMGIAITDVMPETRHGLCVWHIMENATKHLSRNKVNGSNILGEFKACMYEYEGVEEFEKAFSDLETKVECDKNWLSFIYAYKEKWAHCYMKNARSLGIRSTQLSESINSDLKDYLKSDMNLIRLLKNFERIVNDKRENENKSEYEWTLKQPKIKMVLLPILQQTGFLYT